MRKLFAVTIVFILTFLLGTAFDLDTASEDTSVDFYDERPSPAPHDTKGFHDADDWIVDEHVCPRAIPGRVSLPDDGRRLNNGFSAGVRHHLVDSALSTAHSITAHIKTFFAVNPAPIESEATR